MSGLGRHTVDAPVGLAVVVADGDAEPAMIGDDDRDDGCGDGDNDDADDGDDRDDGYADGLTMMVMMLMMLMMLNLP